MTPPAPPLILIIEDDAAIRLGLRKTLAFEGYRLLEAQDGEKGLELAFEKKPDLILLDLMLPRLNGYEFCRTLRKHDRKTPILILSAKDQEVDKVMGLDLGADDYVTKPFSTKELAARVKAALRRSQSSESAEGVFEADRIRVDFGGQSVSVDGRPAEVSTREFRLLRYLIENRGRVLSRDQILNQVWGFDYEGTARTIDNFINKLRSKIEADPAQPELILTVRGVGYKFAK
ncbi:MAG: response regulator transcription factor [Planctomycetaceae bacterium]